MLEDLINVKERAEQERVELYTLLDSGHDEYFTKEQIEQMETTEETFDKCEEMMKNVIELLVANHVDFDQIGIKGFDLPYVSKSMILEFERLRDVAESRYGAFRKTDGYDAANQFLENSIKENMLPDYCAASFSIDIPTEASDLMFYSNPEVRDQIYDMMVFGIVNIPKLKQLAKENGYDISFGDDLNINSVDFVESTREVISAKNDHMIMISGDLKRNKDNKGGER